MDGVGSAFEGLLARRRIRTNHFEETTPCAEAGRPRAPEVLDQRPRLVLREHVYGGNARIGEIAEDEIYDLVSVHKRQRGLRVRGRQWIEAAALAARQH